MRVQAQCERVVEVVDNLSRQPIVPVVATDMLPSSSACETPTSMTAPPALPNERMVTTTTPVELALPTGQLRVMSNILGCLQAVNATTSTALAPSTLVACANAIVAAKASGAAAAAGAARPAVPQGNVLAVSPMGVTATASGAATAAGTACPAVPQGNGRAV